MDTLILFKLIFTLFPPDPNEKFKNPLHVSAFCFIGEILSSCLLTTRSDISKSIFLQTMVLAFAEETQRFLSQSLLLVHKLLFHCTSESYKSALVRDETKLLTVDAKFNKIKSYKMLAADLTATKIDDGFKLRCLSVLVSITTELTQLPASNIQFYSKHFIGVLKNIAKNEVLPIKIQNQMSAALEVLANPTTAQRASLKYVAQEKKVPMLKMLEPKIERCFDSQPNMQHKDYYRKSDKQALTNKIKRERKGAIREIRKDNNFIAKMKLKSRMEG
jgi:nucleolar protein 14